MSAWFRHYVGLASDPKFGGIARRSKESRERIIFVWCCLLESASDENKGGRYSIDADSIADLLHCETESIERILDQFEAGGLTSDGIIAKWSTRQYESDKSTDRVRKFRENKQKDIGESDETACNGDETFQKRFRNVTETACNGDVTPPDTDTDTDTEINKYVNDSTNVNVTSEVGGSVDFQSKGEPEPEVDLAEKWKSFKYPKERLNCDSSTLPPFWGDKEFDGLPENVQLDVIMKTYKARWPLIFKGKSIGHTVNLRRKFANFFQAIKPHHILTEIEYWPARAGPDWEPTIYNLADSLNEYLDNIDHKTWAMCTRDMAEKGVKDVATCFMPPATQH